MINGDVIEPETCPTCGHALEGPTPADGQWRYAKGGKTFESIEVAETRIRSLTNKAFEFAAVVDPQGNVRIASRRRPS